VGSKGAALGKGQPRIFESSLFSVTADTKESILFFKVKKIVAIGDLY